MNIYTNFNKNGTPTHQQDLKTIMSWWRSKNGQIPKIIEREGAIDSQSSKTLNNLIPITDVEIEKNEVTYIESGQIKKIPVTGISLDREQKKLTLYLTKNDIQWEFFYK